MLDHSSLIIAYADLVHQKKCYDELEMFHKAKYIEGKISGFNTALLLSEQIRVISASIDETHMRVSLYRTGAYKPFCTVLLECLGSNWQIIQEEN